MIRPSLTKLTTLMLVLSSLTLLPALSATMAGCTEEPPPAQGEPCQSDADCQAGVACGDEGLCLDPGATGDACDELASCCAGLEAPDRVECEATATSESMTREADCVDALLAYAEAGQC